jgi:alpha-glucosidase (family GH31 glycosyl hydrolase)
MSRAQMQDQDPAAWSSETQDIMRNALMDRYRLLPYFYTLFFRANAYGETVVRPLFWNFPNDKNTWNVDNEFMVGTALLVIPVLQEHATSVDAYIPNSTWYYLKDGEAFPATAGRTYTKDVGIDYIWVMIRGGSILPMQRPSVTTELSYV